MTKGRDRRRARRATRHSSIKHQAQASGAIVAVVVGAWATYLGRFFRRRKKDRQNP